MQAGTIANEPVHSWRLKANQSRIALELLHWQQHQLPDGSIQHAGNSGEDRIPHSQYKADGYHKESHTIYKFQVAFGMGAVLAIPIAPKLIAAWTTGALKSCTSARKKNSNCCVIEDTGSSKSGNADGKR